MGAATYSRHAIERICQRGLLASDIDLIMTIGTEVEGGFVVRDKDVQQLERQVRDFLTRIKRLKSKRLVVAGDHVVTAYHARRSKTKKLLRR